MVKVAPSNSAVPAPSTPTASVWQEAAELLYTGENPDGHVVHDVAADSAYDVLSHSAQSDSELPPGEERNLPNTQGKHVAAVTAPVSVEYLPAAHSVQAVAPVKEEYDPASHSIQDDADGLEEYFP